METEISTDDGRASTTFKEDNMRGSVRVIADGEYRICLHDTENTGCWMEFTLPTRAET